MVILGHFTTELLTPPLAETMAPRDLGRALLLGRVLGKPFVFFVLRSAPIGRHPAPAARHYRRLRSIALGLEHHRDPSIGRKKSAKSSVKPLWSLQKSGIHVP